MGEVLERVGEFDAAGATLMRWQRSLAVPLFAVMFAGIPSLSAAGELPGESGKANSIGQYLPYLIGGSVTAGAFALLVIVRIAKQSAATINTDDPNAVRLPTDMKLEGSPLSRLLIPVLIIAGLGVGLYLIFHDVDDSIEAAKSAVSTSTSSHPKTRPAGVQSIDPNHSPSVQPLIPTVTPIE